jgi:hypothetical protein
MCDPQELSNVNNLVALNLDGTLKPGGVSSVTFGTKPAGLAFDPSSGRLYMADDDLLKIQWVDPANPTKELGEFSAKALGSTDTEDVAVNPNNGHVFICNGGDFGAPKIIETDATGSQIFSVIDLTAAVQGQPSGSPEAIAYDPSHDVFFVAGNNYDIKVVNRSGTVLDDITVLSGYRNPSGNIGVDIQGLTLAPSSDPNDDPATMSLYVADAGLLHGSDGRLFEISNPFFWNQTAPVIATNNLTAVRNSDGSMTLSGMQVTDPDALALSETFSLTATTGSTGSSATPSASSGSLASINSLLATGVTYHPGSTPPSTDSMTLTVKDNFGAIDTENFVFAQAGAGPNVTLQGTSGKDVILATNSQDTLTGAAAQDQFVFAPTTSGPSVQHTITDFQVGLDKIDVRQFGNISASALPTETQQGSDTLITLDGHDTLLLKNIAAVNLHGSDFIVHA